MKKVLILSILIFTQIIPAVFAQKVSERCVQRTWIEDKDPKGTNVRDAPSVKGKIIDVIPAAEEPGDEAEISIIGYQNGWLKIILYDLVGKEEKVIGTGWVSAKKVATAVETNDNKPANLYALPKRSSRKVGNIPIYADFEIVGYDCFGLKVKYKNITGWLAGDDTCGNPRTTCP